MVQLVDHKGTSCWHRCRRRSHLMHWSKRCPGDVAVLMVVQAWPCSSELPMGARWAVRDWRAPRPNSMPRPRPVVQWASARSRPVLCSLWAYLHRCHAVRLLALSRKILFANNIKSLTRHRVPAAICNKARSYVWIGGRSASRITHKQTSHCGPIRKS